MLSELTKIRKRTFQMLYNIILASSNKHKVEEFQNIFSQYNISIIGIDKKISPPNEDGLSFEENADIKAKYYSNILPGYIIADDSGLSVEALNGMPGVLSARFAGEKAKDDDNNKKLLKMLEKETNKNARFICALSLALNGKILFKCQGYVKGIILNEKKGNNGFGYDPLFYYPEKDKTFADMCLDEKGIISHRYNASMKMINYLKKIKL